jgi:hypothetical protein
VTGDGPSNTLHVYPQNDLIGHDTSTSEAGCACGPQQRPVAREDGSVGWLLVHNSLDGRELTEGSHA